MTLKTSLVLSGEEDGAAAVLANAEKALGRVEQSTASLARAQAAAKRETDAAKASYKAGELSLEEYNRAIIDSKTALGLFEERHRKAASELRSFGTVAATSTGQAKAGYINLGRQMQDVAQQIAQPGVNLGTIIMQQGGQVADAVAMMGGSFSGFAGFMAGPWGAAITVGVGLLVNLIATMNESSSAADNQAASLSKVALASNGLADSQSALGEMFDLATGKIKSQNDMLRLNVELMSAKLRAEAEAGGATLDAARERAGQRSWSGTFSSIDAAVWGKTDPRAMPMQSVLDRVKAGTMSASSAAAWANQQNFDGMNITKAEYLDAIARGVEKSAKTAIADKIDASLRDNVLDAGLRKTDGRKAKGPSAASIAAEDASVGSMSALLRQIFGAGTYIGDNSKHKKFTSSGKVSDHWGAGARALDFVPEGGLGKYSFDQVQKMLEDAGVNIRYNRGGTKQIFGPGHGAKTKNDHADHFHVAWSGSVDPDKVARAAERAQQVLDNFGERSAQSIGRINAQFDAQPRLIDQAAAATQELDRTIGELRDKKPLNWEAMVADAQAAKGTIQEALVRPFQQLRQESERRLQIDALITAGREDEAAALQIIWQKESEVGKMTAAQKQDVLDMVKHERAVTEELQRRREVIGYYLDASRSIRDTFTEFFSTGSFNFKSIGQTFKRLNGQMITEQLFGGMFRDLDSWLKGQSGLSPSVDFISAQTERAGGAVGAMADAVVAATARMSSAGGAGPGSLESQFDQAFGRAGGGFASSASNWASKAAGQGTAWGAPTKGSVMALTPGNFFGELIRRASTGLKLNLSEETTRNLGKMFQGGMWGQFGSQMVLGKSGGVGSFVGGAFGESLFKAAAPKLFKSLGSFAGPIGSIAGGILGGLIGGLFSKAKTGGVAVGAVNGAGAITGTGGNNAQLKSQLSGSGNSINSALAQIAQQLGGSIGSYSVAIGQRKDEFRVSASGSVGNTTAKKTGADIIYKGKDEAAAIQAAIANAIQDGAIKGLSAAVQKALQSSSNIDQAIQEALKVQDVETAIGGIGAALAKQFADFEKQAAERLRIAQQYGFDVVAMEKRNAEDRLKLSEKLLAEQVGSLQQLIDNMTSGSLFEGSAVDQRQLLLDKIAAAKAEADAGTEGAADKLSSLLEQLNSVSKEAFATTGTFAADRGTILDAARDTIAKANQRITDAQAGSDPALATTNATLDEMAGQNAQMLAAMGITNAQLAQIIANGGMAGGGLASLARTTALV